MSRRDHQSFFPYLHFFPPTVSMEWGIFCLFFCPSSSSPSFVVLCHHEECDDPIIGKDSWLNKGLLHQDFFNPEGFKSLRGRKEGTRGFINHEKNDYSSPTSTFTHPAVALSLCSRFLSFVTSALISSLTCSKVII